jgi:hypothetical protein
MSPEERSRGGAKGVKPTSGQPHTKLAHRNAGTMSAGTESYKFRDRQNDSKPRRTDPQEHASL